MKWIAISVEQNKNFNYTYILINMMKITTLIIMKITIRCSACN